MKVISTIALLAVFAFTSLNAFAQDNSVSEELNDENVTITKPKAEAVKAAEPVKEVKVAPTRGVEKSLTATEVEQKKRSSANSDLPPYHNYNGIESQDEAKKAWIADHPKEYAAMQGEKLPPYHNYKGIKDLDKAKEAWVKDNPEEYKKSQQRGSKK